MGFDPRHWRPPAGSRPVTSNVDTLLAENDALRREVRALRLQLELLRQGQGQGSGARMGHSHGVTAEQVERWGWAMARHPRWQSLRIGTPVGLRALIDDQRRRWWNPALSLEQELDRRSPGLGAEVQEALRGPQSRVRWAVRAAFALYGQRAPEWLSDEPLRVVEELLRRLEQLEPRAPGGRNHRGTRTANHTQGPGDGPAQEDPRQQALRLLGLEPDAGVAAIRRAYRRLVKAHHPDLGGDVEAFHRLDAAYRLLIG